MLFKKTNLFLLFAFFLLAISCKRDQTSIASRNFELYIDYWNPNGNDPEIEFNKVLTSPDIKIDFTKEFGSEEIPPNLVNVNIDNMRIIDSTGYNYEIVDIDAYEFKQNDWREDVEFIMDFESSNNLGVILCLDASRSLGEDFPKVKEYASDFVNEIKSNSPNAQVGVIAFSDQIHVLEMTDNRMEILQFISDVPDGQFTTLYGAMDLAINLLKNSDVESKALVTFTDGEDNNSAPELTPESLKDKLEDDPNNVKIVSYTIGLQGDNRVINKTALNQLAANGGVASFPNSTKQLKETFENFSKSVSTVYTLKYTRNQQPVTQIDKRVLKFIIKAHRK